MTSERRLTDAEIAAFETDGFLKIEGFFGLGELAPLQDSLKEDPTVGGRFFTVHDGDGVGTHDYMSWSRHEDDYVGTATRLARVVHAAEDLIGEPVYHYHSKMVRKPPRSPGKVDWHQDYGGWYQEGCLFAKMLTCAVAVTRAPAEAGCLRMLRGSHTMGRIDWISDETSYYTLYRPRLEAILERFELVELEMEPGDGLFFHPNVLHTSAPNVTNAPRTLMEFSFNAHANAPVFEGQAHHQPKALVIADDDALAAGRFDGVFGRTPLHDIDNPSDEGYRIFHREDLPSKS